jgi:hypothetical protein
MLTMSDIFCKEVMAAKIRHRYAQHRVRTAIFVKVPVKECPLTPCGKDEFALLRGGSRADIRMF